MQYRVGSTVDMIYADFRGKITRRRVVIQKMDEKMIKAFCLERQAPRVFLRENILAVQRVNLRA